GGGPYNPSPWSWVAVLWRGLGGSLVRGGLGGMAWAFVTRQKRQLALFFLVLWGVFTVNSMLARMTVDERYALVLALLLIPYAWFFADRLLSFLRVRRALFFIVVLFFSLLGFLQTTPRWMREDSGIFCVTPPEIIRVAEWLKSHVRPDEFVIIEADAYDVFPSNILIRSGISPEKCLILNTPLPDNWFTRDREGARQYVLERRPAYLVLNSKGFVARVLGFDPQQKRQNLENASFEPVFEQEVGGYGTFVIWKGDYRP
nr:hypothetical protein [Candidatus Omnitrophota bacterium]